MTISPSLLAVRAEFLARSRLLPIACAVFVCVSANSFAAGEESPAKLLFTQHCEHCHSGAEAEGDFSVARLTNDFYDRQNREKWLTVMEQLQHGRMPPKEEFRPSESDLQRAIDWIGTQVESAELTRRQKEGRVVMRRLNRAEYANTVRDMLHVEVDLTDLLPLDTSTNGFDNNAELLHTSSVLMRSYLDAAIRSRLRAAPSRRGTNSSRVRTSCLSSPRQRRGYSTVPCESEDQT